MKWKLLKPLTYVLLLVAFSIPVMQNTLSTPPNTEYNALASDCFWLQGGRKTDW